MPPSLAPGAVHRARLANGLTVLIYRNTAAPVVAINTYVRAGYFDETDDVVGIAHVLEHMFFKGTERRGVGEIAKETKALGGYLNAHTIYDHTSYYTVLPSSGFAQGVEIQADAYANSVIDAGELAKELEVIIQEVKRKEDNPGAVTTETLYAVLYEAHRMRRWRIGRPEALRTLTRDQVLAFYHNFYTPSNTILAIAGDVDVDDAMAQVERCYGALPRRDPVPAPGPTEPRHVTTDFRYRELHGDVAQTQVELGWRTVPSTHQDTPALDMLAGVLGAGRASRLYRAVRDRQLAGSVGASNYGVARDVGVFTVSAETDPDKAPRAARAAWEQLRHVRERKVGADELERAKQLFASRWARQLETSEGQAGYLVEWEAVGGWELGGEYYDAFMRLRSSDLLHVAQRYLAPEQAGVVIYRPSQAPTVASDAAVLWRDLVERAVPEAPLKPSPAAPAPSAPSTGHAPFARAEGRVRVYHTPNGVPVLVRVRPGAAVTYTGAYAAGGAVQELPGHAGITTLVARTAAKGTALRSALQIADASERLGGSIASSVGTERFGWSLSVPTANTVAALELLGDVVQHATLPDDVLETERLVLLSDLAQLRDDMYRYPLRLLAEAAFPDHPYGAPTLGTDASLRAVTAEGARAWYDRVVRCAPYVIAVVGDVDPDQIAEIVAGAFPVLTAPAGETIAAPLWPDGVAQRVESRDKAQTAMALAFPAPPRTDDDRFAARLLGTVASGLGGRFFDELRDRQSLAYTVHAFAMEHRFAGAFVAYIATSPGQEAVARDGLLREFAKLRETPVADDELTRAKRYTLGMHDIRQEHGAAVLGDMVDAWLSGTGLHELDDFGARVAAVTADDILRLARRYFDPERRVEGIVRGRGKAG